MNDLPQQGLLPIGAGMASLVIGTIGLMLFFLPVLGIPVSACGILLGLLGLCAFRFDLGTTLRWSLAGLVISSLGLGVNLAVTYAPSLEVPNRGVQPLWQQPPGRPSAPPPTPG